MSLTVQKPSGTTASIQMYQILSSASGHFHGKISHRIWRFKHNFSAQKDYSMCAFISGKKPHKTLRTSGDRRTETKS